MPYWTVKVGSDFYNEDKEPTVKDDGSLQLHSGQAFPKGTYRVIPKQGNRPPPSKGATGKSPGKPKRNDSTRGYGEDNTDP